MIVFRSLFAQLFAPYVMSLLVLTFVLSMDTVYRLINLIVTKGVNVFSVLLMLIYRMPQFLAVTFPLAMIISAFILMVRLSTELEITAMRAAGMSFWKIGSAIVVFGFFATAGNYVMTIWLQPAGFAAFEEEKIKVLKSHTSKNIVPKVLNYDFNNQVLYVQGKDEKGELKGVFITDQELKPESMVVMADRGVIDFREEQQDIVLRLFDGMVYSSDPETGDYRTIAFQSLDYAFKLPTIVSAEKGGHIWGVSTRDLMEMPSRISKIELMLRLTTPWACLAFAMGAISLGVADPRRGRSGAYLRALILVLVYYILWMGAKEITRGQKITPQILWIPPSAIFCFGLYSLYKLDNHLDSFVKVLRHLVKRG
ncbi:MAG: LptF/LptG family permease [SAR324 cluster bacterium]|nr:LptF/LptG family permease [SAR324 cluster bacterium]